MEYTTIAVLRNKPRWILPGYSGKVPAYSCHTALTIEQYLLRPRGNELTTNGRLTVYRPRGKTAAWASVRNKFMNIDPVHSPAGVECDRAHARHSATPALPERPLRYRCRSRRDGTSFASSQARVYTYQRETETFSEQTQAFIESMIRSEVYIVMKPRIGIINRLPSSTGYRCTLGLFAQRCRWLEARPYPGRAIIDFNSRASLIQRQLQLFKRVGTFRANRRQTATVSGLSRGGPAAALRRPCGGGRGEADFYKLYNREDDVVAWCTAKALAGRRAFKNVLPHSFQQI
ncbi:hypothetical protein EVAR_20687_1 [Eumeta japonica]|uniref:Uncharacterized protein n=1 Tax=Eumeta variegata TaxID=151549 RepID=A0A4C1VBI8_EUMVA|nr:hypothetical protein EVAR_20687_1 [Eumeta japonica]